jgi:hypothetical protein
MLETSLASTPFLLDAIGDEGRQMLAKSVSGDYIRWKQSRSRLENKWRECWEAYLCDPKSLYAELEERQSDRSQIVRPVLYEAVEAIHANLLNALFPANERFFSVIGKTEENHRQAGLIEEFLRNKLEDASFIEKYALFLKQAVITGNTAAAVPWRQSRQTRQVYRPVHLFGVTVGTQKVTREELIYNGPDFETLDMFDFLIDPDASDFEQAKVIRKVDRELRTLKANPAYHHLEHLKLKKHEAQDMSDSNKQSRRRAFGLDESLSTLDEALEKVSLLEAWGDFRIGETVYKNYVCVVANQDTVIRFEPNPYECGMKPFIFTPFIPVPNEIYGIGAIEKSLGLQHAINTLTNQKLDIINLSINSPFTYLINDDVFDPDTLIAKPGALIPVKSHDTLRPIQYLNNFTVAFTEIADLKAEAQEATGALKYFTGASHESARTATEVNALVQGGTQKFSSFLAHLEHTSLEPFLRIVLENARQFMGQPENLRVCGQNGDVSFLKIVPEILKTCDCQFRIDGSRSLINQEQELKAITSFLRLVEGNQALREQVDWLALYKKVYRRLGFNDEGEIFMAHGQSPTVNNAPREVSE